MSDKKSKRAENAEIVRAFSMLFQLGLSIMIPIALSIFIGYKLDRLFETGNILLLVFLFVGMAAGIRSVYVLTKSFYSKDLEKENKQQRYFDDLYKEAGKSQTKKKKDNM